VYIIENSKIQSPIDYNLILILDAKHELVILSNKINWSDIDKELSAYYSNKKGRKGKPIRLMVGLQILKHIYALSDDEVVSNYKENPY
jgi:IS5 family transposase